jgi:hypothetical protein
MRLKNVKADQGRLWNKMIEGTDGIIIEQNTNRAPARARSSM